MGFLIYTFIKLFLGKAKEINWIIYMSDIFSIISMAS